ARINFWEPSVTRNSPAPIRRFTSTDSAPSISTVLESYCKAPVRPVSITQPLNHHAAANKGKDLAFIRLSWRASTRRAPRMFPLREFVVVHTMVSGLLLDGREQQPAHGKGGTNMLHWSLVFLVI